LFLIYQKVVESVVLG